MNDAARQAGLEALLYGREERARVQRSLLLSEESICQITLNIPGLPKKMDGETDALVFAARWLERVTGYEAKTSAVLANGAGTALYLIFPSIPPVELKKTAVELEECAAWARVLDIDVITRDGAISRSALDLPPRRCLLCEKEAKFCARSGAHMLQDLRGEAARLLSRSFNSAASAR